MPYIERNATSNDHHPTCKNTLTGYGGPIELIILAVPLAPVDDLSCFAESSTQSGSPSPNVS